MVRVDRVYLRNTHAHAGWWWHTGKYASTHTGLCKPAGRSVLENGRLC
jgi:hypothetical protein